jgi:excisionase family DNA binding protein
MTSICKTVRAFRSWLEENIAFLENALRRGPPASEDTLDVSSKMAEITGEAERMACRLGFDPGDVPASPTPRSALALLGRLAVAMEQRDPVPTLDVREVARLLGCTERTIWRHEAKGLIPEARRIGGVVRWERDELENWLANAGKEG